MTGRGRGQRRAKRPIERLALEEQWKHWRDVQPSGMVTPDQLMGLMLDIENTNEIVRGLVLMLGCTKSAKIAEALQEIVRLGLAVPAWEARAVELCQHISLWDSDKITMALVQFAMGASQSEIADRVAARFGGNASFEAARRAIFRTLAGRELEAVKFLLRLPLGARRKELRIVRAKLGIDAGQILTVEQALEVIDTLIQAHLKARKRETAECE